MPRPTKACATCRRKRVKCDATMPHCLVCLKFERQCPGPTEAPLRFIDTSSYPSGKKPRKKPSPPTSRTSSPPRAVTKIKPAPTSRSITTCGPIQQASKAVQAEAIAEGQLPPELAYVTLVQVSGKYVLNEAMFANLARFLCADGRSLPGAPKRSPTWLHALPRLAAQPESLPHIKGGTGGKEALTLAMRATTAAFSGIESRNTGMLEYASGLYGEALRAQHRVVAENAGGEKGVGMDMVGASVMLSMFEAIVATTGSAYAEHVVGVAKMLNVVMSQSLKAGGKLPGEGGHAGGDASSRGKESDPLLTHIFFHTRIQLAYVYLTSTEERIRNDGVMQRVLIDTCGWPFEKLPLNQQIILPLVRLIQLSFEEKGSRGRLDWEKREALYQEAKHEVEILWDSYGKESQRQRLCWTDERTGRYNFRDPFTAIQYAYFSACWVLLSLLTPSRNPTVHNSPASTSLFTSFPDSVALSICASPSPPPPPLTNSTTPSASPSSTRYSASPSMEEPRPPTATDHFGLILSAAAYLRVRNVGFSYLRVHLPLVLVGMYAPKVEQRKGARSFFEEWEAGTLRGIGFLGLERMGKV